MNTDANKSAIREFFAAIDKAQDMAPLGPIVGPSYVSHFPGVPPMNLEATKWYANVFFAACPGLRHTVEEVLGEGNTVAAKLTIRGTHTKPFPTPAGPIPPQNKAFTLAVINWYRFDHGKLVEQHVSFDMMGFLQQVGAMPQS
jgi:predicted ester cyclase